MKGKLWLLIGLMLLFLLPASVAGAETITGDILDPGDNPLSAEMEQMLYLECESEDWTVSGYGTIYSDEIGIHYMVDTSGPGTFKIWVVTTDECPYTNSIPQTFTIFSGDLTDQSIWLTYPAVTGKILAPDGQDYFPNEYEDIQIIVEKPGEFAPVQVASTSVAADGTYRLGGIVPGNYTLRIEYNQTNQTYFAPPPLPLVVTENNPQTIDLQLTNPQLKGSVRTPEGDTFIPTLTNGARVVLLDEENYEAGEADVAEDGSYVLGGIAEGSYRVKVEPSGADHPYTASIPTVIELSNDATLEKDLSLTDPQLQGTVYLPDGQTPITSLVQGFYCVVLGDSQGMEVTSLNLASDGKYKLGGIEPGDYVIQVEVSDTNQYVNSLPQDVTLTTGSKTLDLTIATPMLQGKVSNPDDSHLNNYYSIEVKLTDLDGKLITSASVDYEGNYIIGGVPAGSYLVKAAVISFGNDGFFDSPTEEVALLTGQTVTCDLVLTTSVIHGTVLQPDGKTPFVNDNIHNVDVVLATLDGKELATYYCYENADYSFGGIADGDYQLQARVWATDIQTYFDSRWVGVKVVNQQMTSPPTLALGGPDIEGSVKKPDNSIWTSAPDMEVRVIAFDAHNQEVASCPLTSDSAYRLGGLAPGPYWLQAEVSYGQTKYACNSVPVEVTIAAYATSPIPQDLQLTAPLVQGRVLQPDKTTPFIPGNNKEVMVMLLTAGGFELDWTVVDSQGRYCLGDVPAGTYYLQAIAQGTANSYADSDLIPVPIAAGQVLEQDISLNTTQIRGTVFDPDGKPLSLPAGLVNVQLTAAWDESLYLSKYVSATAGGLFKIGGLPEGDYRLMASYEYFGLSGQGKWTDSLPKVVHLQADQETYVTLNLTRPQINGQLLKPDGSPYTAVYDAVISISLTDETGNGYWTAQVQPDGTFILGGIPTGRYQLTTEIIYHSTYTDAQSFYVDVVEGAAQNIQVQLTTPQIRGKVFNADGTTPDSTEQLVQVYLSSQDNQFYQMVSLQDDGTFLIGGLSEGTYYLKATTTDNWAMTNSLPVTVTVEAGQIKEPQIFLTRPRVQGKVLTPAGDPLIPMGYTPGSFGNRMTDVILQAGEQSQDRSDLAEDGVFRMGAVPAAGGEYTLQASPNEMMGQPWAPSEPITVTLGTEVVSQDIQLTMDTEDPQLDQANGYFKHIYLTCQEYMDPLQVPAAADFTVMVNQQAAVVDSVQVVYKHVILQLQQALNSTDQVSVTYTPGAKPVQDLAGNPAPALSAQTVTMAGTEQGSSGLTAEFTWDNTTADAKLIAPGAQLLIKAVGQSGGTASAVLQYKTLLDEQGQPLATPRKAQTTVTLTEITASPGQYQGSFPVAGGISQLLSLQVSLNTGTGDPQTWQATDWPLDVAGALTISCTAEPSDLLNGARLVVWSNSQLYSQSQTLTGAGEITLYVKPATDYQARLLSSDNRVLASREQITAQGGMTLPINMQAISLNTLSIKVLEQTTGIPVKDMILSLVGPNNRILGNLKTDADGWTPWLSGAGDYNLQAGDNIKIKVNLAQRMYNPVADKTFEMVSGQNEVIIRLEPIVRGIVQGKVLSPIGTGLAGVTINASQVLQGKTYTNRSQSGADGSYSLELYIGAALLQAQDPTYKYVQPEAISCEVKAENNACNLNMERSGRGTIAMKLFTKHLSGDWQEVQLNAMSAELYQIKVDGIQVNFWPAVVYGQPNDQVKISVDGTDYNLPAQEQTVTLDQDSCASVEFRLEEKGGRVQGVLTDKNDQPLNYYCQWELLAKGADGGYTFKKYVYSNGGLDCNIPDVGEYRVRLVEAMGYGPAYVQKDFTITAGVRDLGNLQLMDPGVFSGQPGNALQSTPSEVTPGTSYWLSATYKNSSNTTVQAVQITLEIPAGTECLPAYTKINNQPVNTATMILNNNRLTIPLGDIAAGQAGEASCYLRVLPDCQADTLGAAAQISYKIDSQMFNEALGSAMVRNIRLSLQAPERINSRQVYLSGRIPPGQLVEVFAGQELLGSAQPAPGGSYWEMNVALPDKGNPFLYLLHARSLDSQGNELSRTADVAVIYDINQPQLLEMTVQQGSNSITADCSQGVARFPFSINPSYPIEVLLKFNHPDQVENVQIYLEGQKGLAANAVRGAYDLYQASVVSAGKALGAFYVNYDIKSTAPAVSWEPVLTTPTEEELLISLPPGMQDFVLEGEVEVTPLNNENTEYLGKALFRLPNRNNLKVEVQIKIKLNTDFQPSQEQIAAAGTGKVYGFGLSWTESPEAKRVVCNMSGYLPQDLFVDASINTQGFQAQDVGWITYSQFVAQTTYDGYSTVSELNDTVAGAKGYADKISDVMGSMDDIMECPDMAADIAPQMGKALAATVIGEVGKQALNIGGKFMRAALTPAGSLVFSGVSAAAGKAIDTMVDNQIKAIPKAKCKKEKEKEKEKKNKGKGKKTANPAWIYDPSGIIYETVPDNPLSGVTVSVFYQDETQNWQLWDADWYGQINPQLTINDGRYGWDVPAGKWQVIAQKEGYENGRSAEMDVPPPHFDVNIPMVSRVAPAVSRVTPLLSDSLQCLEIVFDRYVLTDGLDAAIIVKDKNSCTVLNGTVTPLNAVTLTGSEGGMAGAQAAKTLRYNLDQTPADGTVVIVEIKSTAQSYAGTLLGTDYQTEVTLGQDTTGPVISDYNPQSNASTSLVLPGISAKLSDAGSGINESRIQIKVDDIVQTANYDAASGVAQAQIGQVLSDGAHDVSVTVSDLVGNQSQTSWSFTVDTRPPVLSIQVPSGSITGSGPVTMSVSSDEDLSAAPVLSLLLPDGSALDLTPSVTTPSREWSASYQLSEISPPGNYSLYVTGSDQLENQITTSQTFQVLSSIPVITLNGEAVVRIVAGTSYSDPGATAVYMGNNVSRDDIIVNNPVDANLPGRYDITYNVSCDSHAAQPVTRTVLVVPPAPIIAIITDTSTIAVSGMSGATVILYDQDNQIAATQVLQTGETSCTFTNLGANQYLAVQRLNGQDSAESNQVTIASAAAEGCFIATAAFGSKFTWPVSLLRHFRDQFLLTNVPGAAFVDFYYRHSPPIAQVIADSAGLKLLVRILLLPLIITAYMLMHPFWLLLMVASCIALLYRRRNRQAKA